MKQNVSETESNWGFWKKCKNMSTEKKVYLMLPSKHGHLYQILILPLKMVKSLQQHENASVHWLKALPLLIVAKSCILNLAEFLDLSLKTLPCTKTSLTSCESQYFFLILKFCYLFQKLLCFYLFIFTVWWSIFDQPFRRLLPLSSFCGSSQWLFTVKITCKRINFMKK